MQTDKGILVKVPLIVDSFHNGLREVFASVAMFKWRPMIFGHSLTLIEEPYTTAASRRLAAIMFTDVVGYTALMGRVFEPVDHERDAVVLSRAGTLIDVEQILIPSSIRRGEYPVNCIDCQIK